MEKKKAVFLTHTSLNHLIWCHWGRYYVNSREQDEQRNCEAATVLAAKEMKMDQTAKNKPWSGSKVSIEAGKV